MRVSQKDITISIFELNNNRFQVIGQVNQYTSLRWIEEYSDSGSFELWAPITDENARLFKHDRVIWIEGENTAGIIEGIKETVDTNEQKVYDITGRMLISILDRRIIWNTYDVSNKYVYTVLRELVNQNCITPELSQRVIPYLELGSVSESDDWGRITIQRTGDELLSVLQDISNAQESGFNIGFNPVDGSLSFNVVMGESHALGSDNPVVLSSSMEDILNSTYYSNKRDYKNIALVAGEGEGDLRVKTTAGDNTLSGYQRKELYVDARDLQKDTNDQTVKQSALEDYTYDKETIDEKIEQGGGGTGGHTIKNASGTSMTQRTNLQFIGATVEDDSTNDTTKVTIDKITIDSALSDSSENPVQNKVIKTALDDKADNDDIPDSLSDLNDDSTHRLVSDTEKSTWNGKQDALSTMSSSELTTGTATTPRSVRADYLKTGINSLIDTKINDLDVATKGGTGKYISSISETNGKITATETSLSTSPTSGSSVPITSGGVYTALQGKVDNKTNTDSFYGTCSTVAGTAAKVVTVTDAGSNFSLRTGVTITIRFTRTNTASNPTLNVNSTGAKSIKYNDANVTTDNLWAAGTESTIMTYIYNGSVWVWVSQGIAGATGDYMEKGVDYVTAGKKDGTTLGSKATAEGSNTTASGISSHAEGSTTTASNTAAHAEGYNTVASGYEAHAEGASTHAVGDESHAEGASSYANGYASHSEGTGTIASGDSQHAAGKYNVEDTNDTYARITGGGTSDLNRSNIETLDWSGNLKVAGDFEDGSGNKLSDKVSDKPTFTEASARANIASGETFATILGKIKKFFSDLKAVAFSGSYNDLSDQPSIPAAANNGTLTIKRNGTNVATFTANQSGNSEADISVPTKTSDLTNDSNYLTKGNLTDGTITSGAVIKGRVYGTGDDEGIVINKANNNYATLTLGTHNGERTLITLMPDGTAKWRKVTSSGSSGDIIHPGKSGTIALTSDIPTALSDLTADATHRLVTDTEKSTWNGKANVTTVTIPVFTPSPGGWRRICKVKPTSGSTAGGVIYVGGNWSNGQPVSASVAVNIMHSSASLTLLSSTNGSGSMIRFMRLIPISSVVYWLDVFFNTYSNGTGPHRLTFTGDVAVSDIQNPISITTDTTEATDEVSIYQKVNGTVLTDKSTIPIETANKLTGFNSRSDNLTWGTQTGTTITRMDDDAGGSMGFRKNNPAAGQMSMVIDGTVWIKEGAQNIAEAIKSLSLSGSTLSYTNLWGTTESINLPTGGAPFYKATVDLSSLDQNTYYPVTGSSLNNTDTMKLQRICVNVHLNSNTKPSWSTHNSGFSVTLDALVQGSGWGTQTIASHILVDTFSFISGDISPCAYTQMNNSSTPVIWCRGGGRYYIYTDYSSYWTVRTSTYTVSGQSVSPTTTKPVNDMGLVNGYFGGAAQYVRDIYNGKSLGVRYGGSGISTANYIAAFNADGTVIGPMSTWDLGRAMVRRVTLNDVYGGHDVDYNTTEGRIFGFKLFLASTRNNSMTSLDTIVYCMRYGITWQIMGFMQEGAVRENPTIIKVEGGQIAVRAYKNVTMYYVNDNNSGYNREYLLNFHNAMIASMTDNITTYGSLYRHEVTVYLNDYNHYVQNDGSRTNAAKNSYYIGIERAI